MSCACGCGSSSGCRRGPCCDVPTSTAACETLPSQIENFTKQFFGELVKTEIDGNVEWVLPCDLDIGLENNSRAAGEGLACYFLRLFRDGIVGLTGPEGATGDNGIDGFNAFTIVAEAFFQPTLSSPTVQVRSVYNSAILQDLNVFIQGSGWYHVDATDAIGNLYLTLTRPLSGVSGFIPAGRLIVPAGYPGDTISGPTGPTGPTGPPGPAGTSTTSVNGNFYLTSGVDSAFGNTPSAITFFSTPAQVLLPSAGTYLLTAIIGIEGEASINANDVVSVKMRNTSIGGDVAGSEQKISNLAVDEKSQIVLNALHSTISANQTVALFGDCTTAAAASAIATRTSITYVRVG